ncbi:CGNR zinc finger domain-containing protein [Georgenia sp. Z1491]|uniref:CGNR zinc finger domain-containing protein n=1 Tax=Georgenia sp. Z1491 TaxID=3416707 RepID=UPI003CEE378B
MAERIRTWDGQSWTFDSGALFLDYVYTGEFGVGQWRDGIISTADELDGWLGEHLGRPLLPLTDEELAAALDLRDRLTRLVRSAAGVSNGSGTASPDDDLPHLAELAAQPDLPPVFPGHEPPTDPAACQALATIARDALVHLRDDTDRLRNCDGHGCPMVFLDLSRGGRRTWCSMARCGNRAKVRAFRDRQAMQEMPVQ